MSSWGIDYDYWFNSIWGFGVHADVVLEKFEVESYGESNSVEREYPTAISGIVSYKPKKHFSFLLGPGIELAKEENLTLVIAGIEYGWEMEKNWELFFSLNNEFKFNTYNSWTFGIGISKFIYK